MSDDSLDTQGVTEHAGLGPVLFMLGEWVGRGVSHGEGVQGRLVVRQLMDGSWLEATETWNNEAGAEIHTDVSFYRFDSQNDGIEVIQLSEQAHRIIRTVELQPQGFRWITGPGSPQLRFWSTETGFRYAVTMPGEDAPVVEMAYERS